MYSGDHLLAIHDVSKIIYLQINDTESCNSPCCFAWPSYRSEPREPREGAIAGPLWFRRVFRTVEANATFDSKDRVLTANAFIIHLS